MLVAFKPSVAFRLDNYIPFPNLHGVQLALWHYGFLAKAVNGNILLRRLSNLGVGGGVVLEAMRFVDIGGCSEILGLGECTTLGLETACVCSGALLFHRA